MNSERCCMLRAVVQSSTVVQLIVGVGLAITPLYNDAFAECGVNPETSVVI